MASPDVAVILRSPFAGPPHSDPSYRLDAARSQLAAVYQRNRELLQRAECALAENRVLRRAFKKALHDRRSVAGRQELLERSKYARMVARLQTMPVIEQAKGIIMAQSCCGAAEAFDKLRRASQRSNMPVRELAAQLVAKTAGRSRSMRQLPAPARLFEQLPVEVEVTTCPTGAAPGRAGGVTRAP